jgi:hypothetical protein
MVLKRIPGRTICAHELLIEDACVCLFADYIVPDRAGRYCRTMMLGTHYICNKRNPLAELANGDTTAMQQQIDPVVCTVCCPHGRRSTFPAPHLQTGDPAYHTVENNSGYGTRKPLRAGANATSYETLSILGTA